MDATPKIFVGGLPQGCDENRLSAYFGGFGNVSNVEVKRDQLSGTPRGFGFVTFDSPEAVHAAVAMNGQHNLDGKNIEVKPAQARPFDLPTDGPGKGCKAGPKGGCKGAGKSPGLPALGGMQQAYMAPKGAKGWSGGLVAPAGAGWGGGKPAAVPYQLQPAGAYGIVLPSAKGKGQDKGWGGAGASWDGGKGCKGKAPAPAYSPWGKGGGGGGGGFDAGKGKGDKSFDRDDAKIFVGGLPKSSGEETISSYFSVFGPVASVQMKMDPATGMSRGFCFVSFEEAFSAAAALGAEGHEIDGKWVEVKSAMVNGKPAPGSKGAAAAGVTSSEPMKIFVGALAKTTTEDTITAYFSEFGTVTEVLLKRDPEGNSKGFAFVSFAEEATVARVLNNYDNNQIEGKWVDVKAAQQAGGKGDSGGKGKGGMGSMGFGASKGCAKGKGWSPY